MISLCQTLVFFIFFLFSIIGCGGKSPNSDSILSSFPHDTVFTESKTYHLNLYLDDSESMRGFVSDPKSTYCELTANIIQRVAETPIVTSDIYTIHTLDKKLFSSKTISDANLYRAPSTPLDKTLQHILQTIRQNHDKELISIIVSDFVLSNDRDISNFTMQLRELAKISPEFFLVGVKSSFDGWYFTEYPQVGKYKVDKGTRPFYFFVNTKTKKTLQMVKDKLLPHHSSYTFSPSQHLVKVDSIQFEHSKEWGKRKEVEFKPATYRNLASIFTFLRKKSEESRTTRFKIKVSPQDTTLHFTNSFFRFEKEMVALDQKHKIIKKAQPNLNQIHVEVSPEKTVPKGAWYVAKFTDLPASKDYWSVYRFRGFQNDIKVPTWIEEWSTDDDSNIKDVSKTLFLKRFCNVLIANITEQIPIVDLYVCLK